MPTNPLLITVAPNGARKTKADHPALPVSSQELAEEAMTCCNAGAGLIHLHIRDNQQQHSLDVAAYRKTINVINAKTGGNMMVQVTSESVGIYTPAQQMQMVRELKPQAVSLALSEIIPKPSHEATAKDFLHMLHTENILPQYILYSAEELERLISLYQKGILPSPPLFTLFVLGKKPGKTANTQSATPDDLIPFLKTLSTKPNDIKLTWAACAFGPHELDCLVEAIKLGGHARVGFENNLHLKNGTLAPNNAALISQLKAAIAPSTAIMKASQIREAIYNPQ